MRVKVYFADEKLPLAKTLQQAFAWVVLRGWVSRCPNPFNGDGVNFDPHGPGQVVGPHGRTYEPARHSGDSLSSRGKSGVSTPSRDSQSS